MERGTKIFIALSIFLLGLIIFGAFLYLALAGPDNAALYTSVEIVNPAAGLSVEEGVAAFNESFVFYLLYSIKAYNLHTPPLSDDAPRITIFVEEDAYYATIEQGNILVDRKTLPSSDIIIHTTRKEAVQMLHDQGYTKQSFVDGNSRIELIADKTTLFSKGYLQLYTELTGKSVTGNIVAMYTS